MFCQKYTVQPLLNLDIYDTLFAKIRRSNLRKQNYIVTFEGITSADANLYAEELRSRLLDASPYVEVNRKRDNPSTQDFGATLILALGTPAVAAVAKAIGDWLISRRQAGITIKTANGEIIGTNLTSKDAMKLAEMLLDKK